MLKKTFKNTKTRITKTTRDKEKSILHIDMVTLISYFHYTFMSHAIGNNDNENV